MATKFWGLQLPPGDLSAWWPTFVQQRMASVLASASSDACMHIRIELVSACVSGAWYITLHTAAQGRWNKTC